MYRHNGVIGVTVPPVCGVAGWLICAVLLALYARPLVAENEFQANHSGELVAPLAGAGTSQSRYTGLLTAQITHRRATPFGRLSLTASALWLYGASATPLLNDLNGVSNISGISAVRLNHLTAALTTDRYRLAVGRFDLDADFMAFASGDALINSGFGAFATLSINQPVPTYPSAGLGALFEYAFSDKLSLTTAVFDGDVGDGANDSIGFELASSGINGALIVSQLDYTSHTGPSETRWLAGGSLHTGSNVRLDTGVSRTPNGIIFAGVERKLLERQHSQLWANLRFSAVTSPASNVVTAQVDGAISLNQLLPALDDRLSLGVIYVRSSRTSAPGTPAAGDEWVTELNYRLQPFKQLFLQPSLQFIRNRNLTQANHALVGIVRFGLEF